MLTSYLFFYWITRGIVHICWSCSLSCLICQLFFHGHLDILCQNLPANRESVLQFFDYIPTIQERLDNFENGVANLEMTCAYQNAPGLFCVNLFMMFCSLSLRRELSQARLVAANAFDDNGLGELTTRAVRKLIECVAVASLKNL